MILPQDCRLCPRLVAFRYMQRTNHPGYHGKPVNIFGADIAHLLIIGLAPGLHGANATGRPFTGDESGDFLFKFLYRYGFATKPASRSIDDGTRLLDCRITNAVKCLPPKNKPIASEINNCNRFLEYEIKSMPTGSVLLALGTIAHRAIIKALGLRQSGHPFYHQVEYTIAPSYKLIDSFHPSRYMVQTKKLTPEMFEEVFIRIRRFLG